MSLISRHNVDIEFGDCDPAQIVFYPNYFAWFDASTHVLFGSVGLSLRQLAQRFQIIGMPLTDASAKFFRPSTYGQRLVVESRVEAWENKRFIVHHRVFREGELMLEGREVRALVRAHPEDPQRVQAVVAPDELRKAFEREAE